MAACLAKGDGKGLHAIDAGGVQAIKKLKPDEIVIVEMKRARNPKYHRKFFALLNLVFGNQSRFHSLDELLDAIKCYVGHCRTMRMRDGTEYRIPKSISFAKMDQSAFDVFYNRVVDMICREVLPRVKREDLERELAEILGVSGY